MFKLTALKWVDLPSKKFVYIPIYKIEFIDDIYNIQVWHSKIITSSVYSTVRISIAVRIASNRRGLQAIRNHLKEVPNA